METEYVKRVESLIKENRIDILLLIGLFLFSFGVKAIPHENPDFKGVYGFDPTWHARMMRFVVKEGYRPLNDPISYWPDNPPITDPPLYHYGGAYAYQLYALIATGNMGYQENLFFEFVAFLPALAGGLGAAAMYFLGKEMRDRKAGLLAGLFIAIQPTVLFRSMYGFAEEDAIGIALTILTMAAYVWAFKKGTWKHGIIAGLVLLTLILTWTFSPFTLALLALFTFVNSLFIIAGKHYKELENRLLVFGASLLPIVLMPVAHVAMNWHWNTAMTEMIKWLGFFVPVILYLLLVSYYFNYHKNKESGKIKTKPVTIEKRKAYQIGIACILLIGLVFLAFKGEWMVDYIDNLLKITGQSSKLALTVGEEHPKTFAGIISEMNWLANFFLLGLVYLPLRRFFKWKDPKCMDMLPFFFAAVPLYLYINKAKMGYIFGPGETLLLGIILADIIGFGDWLVEKEKTSKSTGDWLKMLALLLALTLFFIQLPIGIQAVENQKMNYMPQPEWVDMYEYLKAQPDNTNFVMMTWWDYGHWSAWNNIKTTLDNTNQNPSKVIETAKIFTDLKGNSSAELEEKHLEEMKRWGVTHLAVDRTLVMAGQYRGKWGALTFLGDNNCIKNSDLKKYGYTLDQFSELVSISDQTGMCRGTAACPSGFDCTHPGEIGIVQCDRVTIEEGKTYVLCPLFMNSRLNFTESEWKDIVNTRWPGYDLTLNMGGLKNFKVYGQPDDTLMFFHTKYRGADGNVYSKVLEDAPINYMLGIRWFFKDPTLKYTKLVEAPDYNVPSREVVLYEVHYEGIETPEDSPPASGTNLSSNPFNPP